MLRGWTSKGKKMRMWRWRLDWMLVQGFASSCMAMALTLRYGLEHLKNATTNVLRKSWNMRPLLLFIPPCNR